MYTPTDCGMTDGLRMTTEKRLPITEAESMMVHEDTINVSPKKGRYLIVSVFPNPIREAGRMVERYTTQEMLPSMPLWIPRILQVTEPETMIPWIYT